MDNEEEINLLVNKFFLKKNNNPNSESESDSDSDSDSDSKSDSELTHTETDEENEKCINREIAKSINELNRIYSKPIKKNKNDDSHNEDIVLGIDLGTTNSCVAVWRNGNVEIITDEFGNRTIPSVVAFTNKTRYIGLDAKNQTEINPENVIYEVKRLMGKKIDDKTVQDDKEFMTYNIEGTENSNIIIKTGINKTFTPEEISSMILSKIKMIAHEYLKQEVTKVVISIPANYNDAQRQATKDAATIAGLDCLRIIHEPTAASLAYGLQSRSLQKMDESFNIIVYDFGGGTLDVSLLNISGGLFEVLGSTGVSHLGGSDFDKKIMKYCLAFFKKTHNIQKYDNMSSLSLQKLRRICENAKKILSTSVRTTIAIKNFYDGKDMFLIITQEKMIEICRDLLIIAIDPLDDILKTHNMCPEDIDDIIMVGGMTRMPAIRNNIKNFMRKEPNCSVNPDEVVAMGAAIQGYIMTHDDDPFADSMRLLDVLPLSLGLETIGGVMSTIVKKNTIIPIMKKKLYTTDSDYETSILIKIFEGERKMTKDNFFVGDFELNGIESLPRGIPEIEVQFSVDANGIITVSAEDTDTQIKNSITITGNKGRLSKNQINKMIADAKSYELKDKLEKVKKQLYYEIDDLCSNIKLNIKNNSLSFKLHDDDKKTIENELINIDVWLHEKNFMERDDDENKKIIDKIKGKYGTLILKANIDQEDIVKSAYNGNLNATTVYDNDIENEDFIKESFDKIEEDDLGLKNIPDLDKNELKESRNCLIDLCNSIFDMLLNNRDLNIKDEDFIELRDIIDDTLLWIHVHMKATKIDYNMKIDTINTICNNIMNKYNNDDAQIFKYNEVTSNIKSCRDELEQLCYLVKSMIMCDIISIEQEQIDILSKHIDDTLNWFISTTDKTIDDSIYKQKTDEINNMCNKSYSEHMNKINNIDVKSSVIFGNNKSEVVHINNDFIENVDDALGGVSIQDILKLRKKTN